jgi:hypothetical protein
MSLASLRERLVACKWVAWDSSNKGRSRCLPVDSWQHIWQRAAPDDPDLALVNAAWDRLPAAVKAGIVAMVQAAAK